MSKKKKKEFQDSGVTIADMNVEGMPWYRSKKEQKLAKELKDLNITPKERRAMIRGAYRAYLPLLLFILLGYVLAFVLIYFLIFK
ncbi:MAG TPA: hypothetical protein VIK96_03730 [Bacilli bacterium]